MSVESFITSLGSALMSDRAAAGAIDLAIFPGPRRLKKRLAKKILRAPGGTWPQSRVHAAIKTIRRPLNRANWRAWQGLTDEERAAAKMANLYRMATFSMAGVYLAVRNSPYLAAPMKRGKRSRK